MITEILKGDLLDFFDQGVFDGIAHGCNCFCNMGSGIAPQIADRYPNVRLMDDETEVGDILKLGGFTVALKDVEFEEKQEMPKVIYNAYTQYSYGKGKHVEYSAIANCFKGMNQTGKNFIETFMPGSDRFVLGIPQIGAGLGGGDWDLITEIIQRTTPDIDVIVVEWDKK